MKNFIANMMREKVEIPLADDEHAIKSPHESYDGTSDLASAEAERRNAEIFRNLTFDCEGNPIRVFGIDVDKMSSNKIQPKYKIGKQIVPEE